MLLIIVTFWSVVVVGYGKLSVMVGSGGWLSMLVIVTVLTVVVVVDSG